MSEDRSQFTLIIAPNASSRVRRFQIDYKLLYITCGAIAIVALLVILAIVRLARHEALNLEYLSAKAENERLKRENDAYQNSYSKLKGQISYIQDMSQELARKANMEEAREIDQQPGIGGPETITSLDRAADTLERDLRRISDRLRDNQLRIASIPTGLPVNGYVTDNFGIRHNPFSGEGRENHEGLDIAVDFGTPVTATADGIVIWAAPHGGYGNAVVIYHSNGITTRYGHLSKITVEAGQRVRRGDQVGNVGSTGRSTGPHVHYEVRENDQPVDPQRYIGPPRP